MATTTLSRTFTAGDKDKWTFSTWLKKAELGSGSTDANFIFCAYADASNYTSLHFDTDETLHFYNRAGGGAAGQQVTSALFKDVGAWYHLVCVWDSGNASSTDRMKLYVNGAEVTAFAVDNAPTQDLDSSANVSGNTCYLGTQSGSNMYFTGVLAHSHFCDGQAYAASDFGETDSTSGIWVAKTSPSVTYGTNGFFLKYQDTSNFGDDSSGETNDFTLSGTMTQTQDTPDNNFSTINPLSYHVITALGSLANSNTTATAVSSAHYGTFVPTLAADTGKWYVEGKVTVTGADRGSAGVVSMEDGGINLSTSWYVGEHSTDTGYQSDGNNWVAGSSSSGWSTYTTGDIIGIALDLDNRKVYFHKNGVYEGSGDPVAGTNGLTVTADVDIGFAFSAYNGSKWDINYGNGYFGTTAVSTSESDDAGIGSFEYDVPAGYYTLCTTNLGDQS